MKYRWERDECYMLVDAGGISASHYQLRMLEDNRIDGLLKVQLRQINQQSEYCYTISGRQSMIQRYENVHISVEEIKKLMAALNKTAGQLEEFLLNIDSLRLEPEWIYWKEGEDGQPEFCYYPEEVPEKSFREHVRTLLQYLLNKISHKDSEAVSVVYGLYQIGIKDTFRMQELMRFLFYGTEENEDPGGEENQLSGAQEDAEWGIDDVCEASDYEMSVKRGGRKRRRQKWQKQQKMPKEQQRVAGKRRIADYVLTFLVAVLALAAVFKLAFLLYGRHEMMSEKEKIIYIGLICAIVIASGIAIYKLMAKTESSVSVAWKSPEETAEQKQMQEYDLKHGIFSDEYPEQELKNSHQNTECPDYSSRWETTSESRNALLYRETMPEQNDFPEATCILTGFSSPSAGGWWFRHQGEKENIKDFFISGKEGSIMVGKKLKTPDISLNWPTVSRRHAVFQIQNGMCTVRDCGSTNGTYLNGDRLGREEMRVLFSGSELKFADVVFLVEETVRDENATTVLTGL